jgi:glycosyltransferase involved in cell wall biosynthesis
LRAELEKLAGHLGIAAHVTFAGHVPHHEVWNHLAWADVLIHTGVIAPSGDRDGLPNVIPEAMSIGVLVVTSPAAATTEAVTHGLTGLVARVDAHADWVSALRRLATDDPFAEKLRRAARQWVEENFDAHKNAERLLAHFEQAMASSAQTSATQIVPSGHDGRARGS